MFLKRGGACKKWQKPPQKQLRFLQILKFINKKAPSCFFQKKKAKTRNGREKMRHYFQRVNAKKRRNARWQFFSQNSLFLYTTIFFLQKGD